MNSEKIQKKLESVHIQPLSMHENELVWEQVRFGMTQPSKATYRTIKRKSLFKIITALALIFGITAETALAADNAKPGDLLFPVDRAIENFRISVASGERKNELKVEFALERVAEVKDVIREVSAQESIKLKEQDPGISKSSETSATSSDSVPPEATSSASSTAAKTETATTSDKHASGSNKEAGATSTAPLLKTATSDTETMIPSDLSTEKKKRIELALGTALSFLGEVKGDLSENGSSDDVSHINLMIDQMNKEINTLPENVTFEVDLSSNKKGVTFEVTSQDNKPQIQIEVAPKPDATSTATTSTTTSVAATTSTTSKPEEPTKTETPSTSKLKITNGDITIIKPDKSTDGEPKTTSSANATPTASSTESTTTPSKKTATSGDETLPEQNTDSTTTVKVFLQKLDKDFQFSTTDEKANIHKIIEDYMGGKKKSDKTN